MSYIEELQNAILNLHSCEADYVETVPITETFQDQIVWEGSVEVFNLRGHPKAKRAFAWSHETDKGRRYVTVLELPPIDSAQKAVRAAIVDEARKQQKGS